MAINNRGHNVAKKKSEQVKRVLRNSKLRAEFLNIAVRAAQRQVREISDYIQSELGAVALKKILKKECASKEKRIADVNWDFNSKPPKDKTILGCYEYETHTVRVYKSRIRSLPVLLETLLHELLHSCEERHNQAKGVGDNFRKFSRLPHFLSLAVAESIGRFNADEKNDVRDSVGFFLKIYSKRKMFSHLPEVLNEIMKDKKMLASIFEFGTIVWHELQVDDMACHAINKIIESGECSGILSKKNLTSTYPDRLFKNMQIPLNPVRKFNQFDGLRGYLNSHQAMAWWLNGIFSDKDQLAKYEKFQQMARGHSFFGREGNHCSVGSRKIKNTLEKKLRDCLMAVDPYILANIFLSFSTRRFIK